MNGHALRNEILQATDMKKSQSSKSIIIYKKL